MLSSWLVRKMQTRTIRYHYTPFRMAKIQNTDAPNTGEDVETLNKNSKDTWEDFLAVFLIKVNILLPYDPIIKLLGIYPKELKDYIHTKTYTQMFVAALFIIVKTWKQPRYLSIGEWMNKLWYIQILEHFSVQKKWVIRGHMHTCGWFMLMFDRKQNSVKQLSFNQKINKFLKTEMNCQTMETHGGILNVPH